MPTDEEAAAIVAALEFLWPQPVAAGNDSVVDTSWRFSGRSWSTETGWPRRGF
ncbi:MAG: hypothetical protein ACI91O_001606 [Candidatus Poriferisodalaceae bacterium]|jgi:hypothetical protein